MKNKIVGILVCMLMIIAVFLPATGTTNQVKNLTDESSMEFVPGEFIVKLKKDATFSDPTLQILGEKYQVSTIEKICPHAEGTTLDNIYLMQVPIDLDIPFIVNDYSLCSEVVYAEPNQIIHLCVIPNDTYFGFQWSLQNTGQIIWGGISGIPDADIDAPEAWNITLGYPTVVIAFIDTGIDETHPDLINKLWNNTDEIPNNGVDDDNNGYIDDIIGWNFRVDNNNPHDGYGHGTMCAGIAAASTNNNIGIAGVGCISTIMSLKTFSDAGTGDIFDAATAIIYAADNDADIISMSFAYDQPGGTILKDAVDYAYNKGVFLCAAAGNGNTSTMMYPASFENVTAVAATNQNDQRCTPADWGYAFGSNYGDWVDIAAPGNLIYVTTPSYPFWMESDGFQQNYSIGGGTSFASPIVAGVTALLLSINSLLDPDIIKSLICNNADPYNSTEYIGTGRINAQKTLTALLQNQPIADFSWAPLDPLSSQQITFDASLSQDPNGTITLYEWDWDNDGIYDEAHNTAIAMHIWANEGAYPITLQVTDEDGIPGTETKTVTVNQHPPDNPTITGPEKGKPGSNYKYTITGIDPEEDMVSAYILWGDDTITDWTTFHNSGETFSVTHTWAKKGTYTVQVKVKDTHGAESGWTTLSVTMPFSYNIPFHLFWERFFERFPHAFPILRHLMGY